MKLLFYTLLLSVMLCAQYLKEISVEHKVLKSISNYESIYRLDDEFNRSFASVEFSVFRDYKDLDIKNELWKITKYTKNINGKKLVENMGLVTLVSSKPDGNVELGLKKQLILRVMDYKKSTFLVLSSDDLNEEIFLIPYKKSLKVSQGLKLKSSSVKKVKPDKLTENKRINGIEIGDIELVLVSARIPKISKKQMFSNAIKGSIRLADGLIDSAEMVFEQLPGNKTLDALELNYVDIKNGGQISFEYMQERVSGIFSKAGKDKYIMRVATGRLAGSAFVFARRDSEIMEKSLSKVAEINRIQAVAAKKRSLASRKALERISFDFAN